MSIKTEELPLPFCWGGIGGFKFLSPAMPVANKLNSLNSLKCVLHVVLPLTSCDLYSLPQCLRVGTVFG